MSDRDAEEYRRVLLYIATQPVGSMAPLIMHWFPTAPPDMDFPKGIEPFTPKPARPYIGELA